MDDDVVFFAMVQRYNIYFKYVSLHHDILGSHGAKSSTENIYWAIFNPNTALRTTYLMSVLFAIGKLSSERDKTQFPLLFDAPTSSFTDAKESEFFNVIGSLDKQVIIVTKSFLKESSNGDLEVDMDKISGVTGTIFRIEKKKPFDDKKLGTIQTIITKIK